MKNDFIRRQSVQWKWLRTKQYDKLGYGRSWELHDKFTGHYVGLIWESEFK